MSTVIQLRRDSAANWTSADPVLHQGETGVETDTGNLKIGDGSTAWTSLAYFEGSGGGSGTVTSVAVESANGFAGTVADSTTTPQITLETTVAAGMVKSSGTALEAATAGTDYLAPAGSGAALTGITATQAGADASGAAATAQSNAETFATSAVATETSRAETAEALLAPLASPALTGNPTAPTQSAGNDSTRLATTAYADSAVAVETSRAETAEALKAPLASPALTGNPTAPTQSAGNNSTRLASTAYADAAVGVETSRAETAEALLAPKASPALTGTPTAPTATALTDSTQVATTAYTDAAVAARVVSGQFLCTPAQYAPGTRTVLTTTSATMAAVSSGNASTGSFTAPASGSVWVTASFTYLSNTSGNLVAVALAAHGTVTPLVCNVADIEGNFFVQGTVPFLVTGLTPGTSYNFDLVWASPNGTTVTIAALGQTSTTPGTSAGGPVTMTVQAV